MRQSNFELLRIVAIWGIVLHHLIINGISTVGYNQEFHADNNSMSLLFINSILVGSVNCFVLISGWFGIKVSIRTIIRLLCDCMIFALTGILITFFMTSDSSLLNLSILWDNGKFTHYWFITHYLVLVLISPVLESSIQNIKYRTFAIWILILIIINVYFGYFLGVVNKDGYNYINFILLYYIGRFLRISQGQSWMQCLKKYSLLLSGGVSILFSIIYTAVSFYKWIPGIRFWSYNSPWVLISSIFLFIYFSKFKFKSKIVNIIATGALGIYLLQGVGVFGPIRNHYAILANNSFGICGLIIYSIFLFSILCFISVIINKMLQSLYSKISC